MEEGGRFGLGCFGWLSVDERAEGGDEGVEIAEGGGVGC